MDHDLRLGIDLGGTKIEAVVVRLTDGAPEVLARVRTATERDKGYEHVVEATARLARQAAHDAALSELPPVGVGMPGGISRKTGEELVKNSNTTCLNGRPFRKDLRAALGVSVDFANDANCFALAEGTFGAARGASVVFGVIMGTGVGGGVVLRGEAWDGAQGIAGEWGHIVLEPQSGPPCYCGKRGCVETFLSGPGIEAMYERRTGSRGSLTDFPERAQNGDDFAQQVLHGVAEYFGRALAIVIDVLDPDVVVLGGGVSNLDLFYAEGIERVRAWVFNDELRTKIVKHELGDSAGVLGAALLPRR
jgi:fructokinase